MESTKLTYQTKKELNGLLLKPAVLLPHNIQQQWQTMHSLTSSKPSSPSSGHVTGTEVNYCHEGHGYHHGVELGKIPFHTFLSDTPHKMKISLCITISTPQRRLILGSVNPLNPELNPICYLLALLDHHFLHVSRIRVKSLTLRLLM